MARGVAKNPETDKRRNRRLPQTREQLIGFRLPPDLVAEFRAETERADVTMTSVVEDGIRKWIQSQKANRKLSRDARRELRRLEESI